ncbi:TIGR00159 family protein [Pustulibacterium marinum]|uniref:Diadenylate cyclase n=1 Tax=Pustulibacterium marinum TaxID=1224947 RepID=A0A1I7FDY8_9FLAO|nr:diadenylate cyclase CdaA [Pustulibacterium marinum]SFU34354.1 TIGR00159 family protein [Pustulibacterium marinum]
MKNPFDFLEIGIVDLLDILLVATLLYYLYKLIKGTAALNIFIGIVIIYVIFQITKLLQMELLSSIFDKFFQAGFFALIVVFQQEIRKFLLMVGSSNLANRKNFMRHFHFLKNETSSVSTNVSVIIKGCQKLAQTKTGALIVIERNNPLDFVKNTGDEMYAEVNIPLLESIFYKNSPLHDGAIIIEDNHVVATRVILPVSNERTIPQRFGLRHRAAVGITERTDALALVVSEETGQISFIKNGEFVLYDDHDELINMMTEDLE